MEKSDGRCGNGFGQPRTRALLPTGVGNNSRSIRKCKLILLFFLLNGFFHRWPASRGLHFNPFFIRISKSIPAAILAHAISFNQPDPHGYILIFRRYFVTSFTVVTSYKSQSALAATERMS